MGKVGNRSWRPAAAAGIIGAVAAWGTCPAMAQPPHPGTDAAIERIHRRTPFADIHAHPSRFHRAAVARIGADELERYRRGRIDVVVASISTDAIYSGRYFLADGTEVPERRHRPRPGEPMAFTLERLEKVLQTVADGDALLATGPAVVDEARRRGGVALLAGLEGGDGLEGRIENLRELHRRGLRLLQLVHFRANELGHIQTYPYSPGGLTPFGRLAVEEANRLGIVLDLAHANVETLVEAVGLSRAPVLFSHTGVRALHEGDRYLDDAEIRAIAARGGVVGIWPNGESVKVLGDLVRHVRYVRDLVGIDHVGFGSDLRGLGRYTEGFGEEADFRAVARALLDGGLSEDEVGKVMGGNFMRVFREVAAQADPAASVPVH